MPNVKNWWFAAFRKRVDKKTVSELLRASGQKIIFPFYHVVSNDPIPHIRHLYTYRNVAAFESDMDFLLRHFTPLHFDDYVKGRYEPDKPYFHLSFDDGLSEMYHIVRPILLEKGIPATFFINSGFADNQALFYRYKVSVLIDTVSESDLSKVISIATGAGNIQVKKPIRFLLSLRAAQEKLIDDIASAAGIDFKQYLTEVLPYMDSHQLRKLQQDDFTLGAHSVDHPEFYNLAPIAQQEQIKQSVAFVRDTFQIERPSFAFPFTADGADKNLMTDMYAHYGVSKSFGTSGIQKEKYPNHIDRIPAEYKDWSLESIVKSELHYFTAKKMLGR